MARAQSRFTSGKKNAFRGERETGPAKGGGEVNKDQEKET